MKPNLSLILTAVVAAAPGVAHANLAGWWAFDGGYTDSSGGGNEGTEFGSPAFGTEVPTGLSGQSLRFAADSDAVFIAGVPALDAARFTLGYFMNQGGAVQGNAGLERLTSRGGDSFETAAGDAHALGQPADGVSRLSYFSPGSGWKPTGVEIPADGWVHVAWRNTATNMELYLDGALAFTGPAASAPTGDMSLGSRQNLGPVEGFDGLMDDVFLWDDSVNPLKPADIASIAKTGLAPFLGDSDGDKLPDTWETQYGFNIHDNGANPNNNGVAGNPDNGAAGDPDKDTLTNGVEFSNGTDPRKADTDGDGLTDGAELLAGTNPRKADTDDDGLGDREEGIAGSIPLEPDSDSDGYTDGFEVAKGSDPTKSASVPPPLSTLVVHFDFEEDAEDLSGTGNNGTLLNNPEFSTDVPAALGTGHSLLLANGGGIENQGANISGSPALASQYFTLAYWIKPTTDQPSNAGLERLTSRAGYGFETAIGSAGGVGGTSSSTGITLSYYQGGWNITNVEIVQDEWVHVAWVSSENGMELFLNGESAYTGPSLSASPGQGLMRIGTAYNNVEGFEGYMDDFRLYAAALSEEDIQTISGGTAVVDGSFVITGISRANDGSSATIVWNSEAGRVYQLQYSTDLSTWKVVNDAIVSGGVSSTFTDSVQAPLNSSKLFYRVLAK